MEPNWSQLRHAYGPADDLPDILSELSPHDPEDPIWGELWDRVCHQGTTYSASPYVLRYLLDAAASWPASGRIMPLVLASAIAASPEFKTAGHEETVNGLLELANEAVHSADISRSNRIYMMAAALVFRGDLFWGRELEGLHYQELCGLCPACRKELVFTIGEKGHYTTNAAKAARREPIEPAPEHNLPGPAQWLADVAAGVPDAELAQRNLCVFGTSRCPECREPLSVSRAIEERP